MQWMACLVFASSGRVWRRHLSPTSCRRQETRHDDGDKCSNGPRPTQTAQTLDCYRRMCALLGRRREAARGGGGVGCSAAQGSGSYLRRGPGSQDQRRGSFVICSIQPRLSVSLCERMGRPPKKPKLSDEEIAALVGAHRLRGKRRAVASDVHLQLLRWSLLTLHAVALSRFLSKKAGDRPAEAVFVGAGDPRRDAASR